VQSFYEPKNRRSGWFRRITLENFVSPVLFPPPVFLRIAAELLAEMQKERLVLRYIIPNALTFEAAKQLVQAVVQCTGDSESEKEAIQKELRK
jgi:hypothetical protein